MSVFSCRASSCVYNLKFSKPELHQHSENRPLGSKISEVPSQTSVEASQKTFAWSELDQHCYPDREGKAV